MVSATIRSNITHLCVSLLTFPSRFRRLSHPRNPSSKSIQNFTLCQPKPPLQLVIRILRKYHQNKHSDITNRGMWVRNAIYYHLYIISSYFIFASHVCLFDSGFNSIMLSDYNLPRAKWWFFILQYLMNITILALRAELIEICCKFLKFFCRGAGLVCEDR